MDDPSQDHPLRDARERGHQRPRVVGLDVVTDVNAVPGEDPVPAGRLGGTGELHLLVRLSAGDDDTEFHVPDASWRRLSAASWLPKEAVPASA